MLIAMLTLSPTSLWSQTAACESPLYKIQRVCLSDHPAPFLTTPLLSSHSPQGCWVRSHFGVHPRSCNNRQRLHVVFCVPLWHPPQQDTIQRECSRLWHESLPVNLFKSARKFVSRSRALRPSQISPKAHDQLKYTHALETFMT